MRFNRHSELEGRHSFLSASKYHWIRYDEEKLIKSFTTAMSAARGSALHDLASQMITMKIKAQKSNATFNRYVNDCIGYGMIPEQVLFFSENAFGTADAIKFTPATGRLKRPLLQVFDLKNGTSKASFDQLLIYCAYFCLEYDFKPNEMDYDLRLYQNDDVEIYEGDAFMEITVIIDRIKTFDKIIKEMREEANG